jgi:hypothetical protein
MNINSGRVGWNPVPFPVDCAWYVRLFGLSPLGNLWLRVYPDTGKQHDMEKYLDIGEEV